MIAPEEERDAGAASVINADEPPAAAATRSGPEPTADSAAPDAVASASAAELSASDDAPDDTSAAAGAGDHKRATTSEQLPHTNLTSTPSQVCTEMFIASVEIWILAMLCHVAQQSYLKAVVQGQPQ